VRLPPLPSPRRRFGQNFLVDRTAVARIVDRLDPVAGEPVVEIGPGRGALTEALLDRFGRLTAIEIDRDLADHLATRHGAELTLIREDALTLDLARLARDGGSPTGRIVVVGNLPYNISKPIASRLVRYRDCISQAVLMFQSEVAQRLTATVGSRAYGPLTVLTGWAYRIESCFELGPSAFLPRPKVRSTVTRWQPHEIDREPEEERQLRACLRTCFATRRKTLRNNLKAGLGEAARVEELLERAELDGEVRAETLALDEFLRLAALWPAARS